MSATIEGVGIGLRMELAEELLAAAPDEVRWLEVHPENYMRRGGRYPAILKRAMERWPVATHGLTMCFGSAQPFDPGYLHDLRGFLRDVGTPWHSDHLCFAGADGVQVHDLLPVPLTEETVETAVQRLTEARDAVGVELAIENVSYYADCGDPTTEVDVCVEVMARADARMLLDVNNVYVNSKNHGFDPRSFIDKVPPERVVQLHVAGHLVRPDALRIDTHGEPVCDDVYDLLEHTLRHLGPKPVLLERDNNIPDLPTILEEVRRLTEIYERATS